MMSELGQEIFQRALSLSPEERAELIERLVSSLDASSRGKIDELWAKEAESRLEAYEQGKIKTIPANEVFEKSRAKKA
jgi:putative addiction module component (TIGR02574 family)